MDSHRRQRQWQCTALDGNADDNVDDNDDKGIIWPTAMAPFQLALIPINMHKSQRLREAVMSFYEELLTANIEVILDDRRERPGVMFADMELILLEIFGLCAS